MGRVPYPSFVKKPLKYFGLNYSQGYQAFIQWSILDQPYHPLFHLRKRIADARPRTGLWWHATAGPNTSRARVVRNWVMRRLRNAFRETLRERGLDENGKINPRAHKGVDESLRASNRKGIREALARGEELEITGSIKMHALPSIVTAKFVDVKKETASVVDGLLDHLVNSARTRHTQGIAAHGSSPVKRHHRGTAEQPWRGKTTRAVGLASKETQFTSRTENPSSTGKAPLKSAVNKPIKTSVKHPLKAPVKPSARVPVKGSRNAQAPAKAPIQRVFRPSFIRSG